MVIITITVARNFKIEPKQTGVLNGDHGMEFLPVYIIVIPISRDSQVSMPVKVYVY